MIIPFWPSSILDLFLLQAQLREVTLQEENAEYEKAILNCENNIHERIQEADLLLRKLQVRLACHVYMLL